MRGLPAASHDSWCWPDLRALKTEQLVFYQNRCFQFCACSSNFSRHVLLDSVNQLDPDVSSELLLISEKQKNSIKVIAH